MQLTRCYDGGYFAENGVTCKSDTEITKFLRNKFFIILYNQKRFDSADFSEDSILKESKVLWLPINTQIR